MPKSIDHHRTTRIGTAVFVTALAACAPALHPKTEPLAKQIGDEISCPTLKTSLWSELYKMAEESRSFPSSAELEKRIERRILERLGDRGGNREIASEMSRAVSSAYRQVTDEAVRGGGDNAARLMQELAVMELGSEETPEKTQIQKTLSESLEKVGRLAKSAALACEPGAGGGDSGSGGDAGAPGVPVPSATPAPPQFSDDGVMLETWKSEVVPPVFGAWKTMATAYQSCDAVSHAALGPLSEPDVEGISVKGTPTASGGKWRYVSDLARFLKSQPFLKSYREPDPSCFDVEKRPLIYDFGGKPVSTSAADSAMDMFTESSMGATDQLGIDCSGFVTASYLTAGLKMSTTAAHRAVQSGAIPARYYMNLESSKLTCFAYAKMVDARGIRPGDVLASSGHVVMIDRVGDDPFGLVRLTSKSQCTAANISPSRYDFTIIHSSAVMGGIGISRMKGKEYFSDGSEMSTAIRAYALAACKAKFGEVTTPKPSTATIVRHSGRPECLDKSIELKRSACLKSCRASSPSI